jgi:predicted dehydrogenase
MKSKIRFAVIGLNHPHIYSQVNALLRGGGELTSFDAKEADLTAQFQQKYPAARLARSAHEILEDNSIQLITSAAIPDERAPLGIAAMQHGKDYLTDKPGATSLAQLAEVRRVQQQTRRIYSILYAERLDQPAAVRAGELVKAGQIVGCCRPSGLARIERT